MCYSNIQDSKSINIRIAKKELGSIQLNRTIYLILYLIIYLIIYLVTVVPV